MRLYPEHELSDSEDDKVPAESHDAVPFCPVTAEKVPADAHDAVPFAQDRLERFQVMLMMPYLFAR